MVFSMKSKRFHTNGRQYKRQCSMLLSFLLLSLWLFAGCGSWQDSRKTQQDFSDFTQQIFQSELPSSTLNMHYSLAHPENYGITEYPITFGNLSAGSGAKASVALENWKKALEQFQKKDLPIPQQMTYDILMDYIKKELPAAKFYLYDEMLRANNGFQAQLPVLLAEYTFYDEQDIRDYLELIACTPDFFEQIMQFEQLKSQKGLFMADFAADDVIAQCNNFTQDAENNYLLSTFDDRVEEVAGITPEQAQRYQEENRQLILGQLIPAYQKLAQDISALKGTGKNSGGLCGLPGGKAYYQYLVAHTTGSDLTIEEMIRQTEAQRQADMDELTAIMTKNPSIRQQCASYQLPTENPTLILEDLQEKMKDDFPTPPDVSFTLKEVHPSLEEYTAPAFYLTPPIDDISQNCIYINQSKGASKLQLYTTLAHEGFPGHLYQNVMERSCGLEPIRSLFGSSGYAEGWATYVEMQSYYYADVEPDVAAFLQKNQAATLSLYATADLGIHSQGWTLRDTVDFFAGYQIHNKKAVQAIYQMIVEEPAHYLKYYIGYLEFLNLKKYAMKRYGADYSDYRFHQALMQMGGAPFWILQEYLPAYWEG